MLKNDYKEADKFKDKQIPDHLYKYFPCENNRIKSFINEELWLAQYDTFNDPEEFNFMQISESNFNSVKNQPYRSYKFEFIRSSEGYENFNINYNQAKTFFETIKRLVSISCFTTDPNKQYFWEEYSNHGNGFCVEYQVNSKKLLYPVIYTNEKMDVDDLLYNILVEYIYLIIIEKQLSKEKGKPYNVINEEVMNFISTLYFNYCCKTEKWNREHEFRIVFSNLKPQTSSGQLVEYSKLGINPTRIYIGKECNEKFVDQLESISKYKNYDIVKL